MKQRVFVIGLDGATLDIIRPLVKEGKLPNFARIMKEGSYGKLKSSIPPITPCAWTSFATGKHPSKHGLYDFNHMDGNPEKKKSVNRTFVRSKSLWRILSEAGKRSIVIDVPLTYPPEDINGILISRVMAPPGENCAYPKSVFHTLRKKGFIERPKDKENLQAQHGANEANKEKKDIRPRKMSEKQVKKMMRERKRKTFENMKKDIEKNVELAAWLMKKEDWDFFMVVFMSADHAGHTFWGDKRKVKGIYRKLDWAVGKLFQMAGEETNKFIMSDHGFTTMPYFFNVNEWLFEGGFLKKKLDFPDKKEFKQAKTERERLNGKPKNKKGKVNKLRYNIVTDYNKTKAYLQSGTSYGIRLNLKGRDKPGIISKSEYETLRNRIIKDLKNVWHPVFKKRIFGRVLKKEDVHAENLPGTEPSPDIFLLSDNMEVMFQGHFKRKIEIFGRTSKGYGFHHIDGIFFAWGKDIKHTRLNSPRITDLTPTILHLLDVPIPEDMDGRVLRGFLDKRSAYYSKEITYQGSSQLGESEKEVYSKKEEKKIKAQLEALGYVE